MKIFISSTVYDLLDLRSEVAEHLRAMGLTPLLSDDKLSSFQVVPDVNSIECCLINVAASDLFLLILDQRYGPSLGKAGYEDISATHLEYRHAQNNKIPTLVFVRDRLEADFTHWRRNKNLDPKFSWVLDKKDYGLFNFLEEHKNLQKDSETSNWYHTFSNVVDLKSALTAKLKKRVLPQQLIAAIQRNEFPLLTVNHDSNQVGDGRTIISVRFKNTGAAPAFSVVCFALIDGERKDYEVDPVLSPGCEVCVKFICPQFLSAHAKVHVTYSTLLGVAVCDEFEAEILHSLPQLLTGARRIRRRFIYGEPIEFEIQDV